MTAEQLLPQIHAALGFELTLIEDIEAYRKRNFPQSYLDVTTPAEEMVGAMYARHAFTDAEGKLVGLNFYDCGLGDEQLSFLKELDLPDLISLNLDKNPITTFTLNEKFKGLVYATLNGCEQLQCITCQPGFDQLARLEITRTAITRFHLPDSYAHLYYLDISQNEKLAELRIDGPLLQLQVAFLRGNALTAFHLPKGCKELVYLYLNNNQIHDLSLPGQFPELLTLQLRDNKLKEFPEEYLARMPQLDGLYLGRNPLPEELSFRLDEVADQNHLEIVREHFAQQKVGELKPNNECKVLLIGNGKAGKTAIVNRIVNDDFDPNWDSTHGISLFQKPLGDFVLNYWDFGGQDLYHATHRLFMQKNAVYLLAWSLETEKPYTDHLIEQADGTQITRRYENYGLRYWLEYAKHLGKGSPMHVVQTKIGKDPVEDKSELGEEYEHDFHPEIAFHAVESSEADPFDNGYGELLKHIESSVGVIKSGETKIAGPLYDLRAYLRHEQENDRQLMSYEDYEAKAKALGVQKPREMLESWLHKSGVVYYRPGKFSDRIILDQAWAIKAIYTLFDRSRGVPYQIEEQQGAFSGAFVQDIWQQKGYPDQDTHELFINFMKSCDLCFEIDTGEKHPNFRQRLFMAPQLLQRARPKAIDDFWEGREVLHYRYQDHFIHEGVIHGFISQTAYLADLREIWRIGIQIKEGNQFACIEAGPHSETGRKELNIRLTQNARPLLTKIRKLIFDLQEGKGEEFISEDGKNYTSLSRTEKGGLFFPTLEMDSEDAVEAIAMRGGHGVEEKQKEFEKNRSATASSEMLTEIQKMMESGLKEGFKEISELLTERGTVMESEPVVHPEAKPILFLAANPEDAGWLRTDQEHKRLKIEYQRGDSEYRRYRFLPSEFAVDINELSRALDGNPSIIHFAGHGVDAGIFITDEQGNQQLLPERPLKRIFKRVKDQVELVILNACHSATQAKIISEYNIYVIGTNHRILDKASIEFSKGFYSALARGKTFQECFDEAILPVETYYGAEADKFEVWYQGEQLKDWM